MFRKARISEISMLQEIDALECYPDTLVHCQGIPVHWDVKTYVNSLRYSISATTNICRQWWISLALSLGKWREGRKEKKASISDVPPPVVVVGKKRKLNILRELGDRNRRLRRPAAGPVSFSAAGSSDFGNVVVSGGRTSGLTRVISNGRREKVVVPGSFGDEEVKEEETLGEERDGKRACIDPEAQVDCDATKAEDTVNDAMDVDSKNHEVCAQAQAKEAEEEERMRQ